MTKRLLSAALTVLLSFTVSVAQNSTTTESTLSQARAQLWSKLNARQRTASSTQQQRSENYYRNNPINEILTPKSTGASAMPAQRWFPGEWEEVQAIYVTWPYNSMPVGHEDDDNWYADPVFSGYGDYYRYNNRSRDWDVVGFGPIVEAPDTSLTGNMASFVNVFANLINAIQQGGAQAWINIRNAEDSSIIKRHMEALNMPLTNYRWIIAYGNSIWYRDCGPICFYYGADDSIAMLDFMYYPMRPLDDSLPLALERQTGIPNYVSNVKWEGGNCLVDGNGMLVTSDAIYEENANSSGRLTWNGRDSASIHFSSVSALSRQRVKDSLSTLIGTRATYIVPKFRYDGGTGHIDLYADMLDENEFVFSQFPSNYRFWTDYTTAKQNIDSLCSYVSVFGNKYKHRYIPFPCTNTGGTFTGQTSYNEDYTRTYSNHTFVNKLIIQPCFSAVVNGLPTAEWDLERFNKIKDAYPGYTLYPIDVRTFDGSGGAIHCITKQIPAENPIRIVHSSLTGNVDPDLNSDGVNLSAIITNRSGIAEATLYYRIDGGQWQQATLTSDPTAANKYSTTIAQTSLPAQTESKTYSTVEYYISATSNNGKTITKPMTASQGGYYTFYWGNNPNSISSVQPQEALAGQFYPNPASHSSSIDLNLDGAKRYTVDIIDMYGHRVHHSTLEASGSITYTINTAKLAEGSYIVVFNSTDGERFARKLTKIK